MLRFAVITFAGLVALLAPANTSANAASQSAPIAIHTFAQQLGRTRNVAQVGVTLAQPYSWWSWQDASYNDTSEKVTIESATTGGKPYFWSYQFHSRFGDGGYVGLQDASVPSGKKIALFSVWQADAAQGASCNPF